MLHTLLAGEVLGYLIERHVKMLHKSMKFLYAFSIRAFFRGSLRGVGTGAESKRMSEYHSDA